MDSTGVCVWFSNRVLNYHVQGPGFNFQSAFERMSHHTSNKRNTDYCCSLLSVIQIKTKVNSTFCDQVTGIAKEVFSVAVGGIQNDAAIMGRGRKGLAAFPLRPAISLPGV